MNKVMILVKKHIVISIIIVLVIIGAVIASVSLLERKTEKKSDSKTLGPENAVEGFTNGMDKNNSNEVLKYYDGRGAIAWEKCNGMVSKFKETYDDVDDDDIEKAEETLEKIVDGLSDYDKYSIKIEKIKEVKEQKGCNELYKVKTKVKTKIKYEEEEEENFQIVTFVVYKGKVISFDN
ncbi:MAG: hypothetical protein IKF52_06165 [Clostridia bacterium]|nr:hypothetical protein [Clostridia bacterium]